MILPWKSLSRPGEFLSRPNRAALPNPTFASDSAYRRATCASFPFHKDIWADWGIPKPPKSGGFTPSHFRKRFCVQTRNLRVSPTFASILLYRRATCASLPFRKQFCVQTRNLRVSAPHEDIWADWGIPEPTGGIPEPPGGITEPSGGIPEPPKLGGFTPSHFRKRFCVQTRNLRVSPLSQAFACTDAQPARLSPQEDIWADLENH